MDCVRLGVVGAGNMGTTHIKSLQQGEISRCILAAVCDTEPKRLERFTGLKSFSSSADLIRSGEVDAVLIATPHYDHTTIGIDALENGLHVLVEKPLAVHVADARRMLAAHAKYPDRVFAVMYQMRTDPLFKRVKKLLDDGTLGAIQRTFWCNTSWFRTQAYYASGGWRATWKGEGGGILLNQCPHNLDLFQWFCGMPCRIRAFCGFGKYHAIETEDEVTAYLEYPNGATGVFIATTGEAPGTDRLEIAGDRGKLVVQDGTLKMVLTESSVRTFRETHPSAFDRPDVWHVDVPVTRGGPGHVAVTQNFVDAILDGAPLVAPAAEGIRSVELSNAMIFSAIEDRTVEVPLDAASYENRLHRLIAESRFEKQAAGSIEQDMEKSFG